MNQTVRTVSLRPFLARAFVDYNPFYLLSALCMLFGLFALNNSLRWSPLPEHNLLYLILILNIYEGMLIGLGIFLTARGLMRDSATLFILEAFFLVDAGFLNAEIFTVNLSLGLGINIVLFLLTALKLAGVFHGLGISLTDGRYPMLMTQMLVLLSMPGVFKVAADHYDASLPPLAIFGFWWVVGLIPILYLFFLRNHEELTHRTIVGVFLGLSFVSILAHLCTSNWVYHVRWESANLSPVLLGLAAAIGASDRHVRSIAMRMRMQLLLPALAIILASDYRQSLTFDIDGTLMSPLRLVLLASTLVYIHGIAVHRHPYFALAGLFCCGGAGLGDSPDAMSKNVSHLSYSSAYRAWSLVPKTIVGWGMVSVASSFVFLGLGTLLSLLKPARLKESEEEMVYPAELPDET